MKMHCDSTAFAVTEAQALAEPLPEPPQHLNAEALQYWPAVINAKRRTAWTESDLVLACQLCRDYAAVGDLAVDLEQNGQVLEDAKGRRYANPAAILLDQASRRIISTARSLQVHCLATTGRVIDQPMKNSTVRDLASKLDDLDDDLFPRMRLV